MKNLLISLVSLTLLVVSAIFISCGPGGASLKSLTSSATFDTSSTSAQEASSPSNIDITSFNSVYEAGVKTACYLAKNNTKCMADVSDKLLEDSEMGGLEDFDTEFVEEHEGLAKKICPQLVTQNFGGLDDIFKGPLEPHFHLQELYDRHGEDVLKEHFEDIEKNKKGNKMGVVFRCYDQLKGVSGQTFRDGVRNCNQKIREYAENDLEEELGCFEKVDWLSKIKEEEARRNTNSPYSNTEEVAREDNSYSNTIEEECADNCN